MKKTKSKNRNNKPMAKNKKGISAQDLSRMPHVDFATDSAYKQVGINPLAVTILDSKYAWKGEAGHFDTFARVCAAIYAKDKREHAQSAMDAMCQYLWMPGGRIIAGAGTGKRVTLMNCYVNKKLGDSLDDIMSGVSVAALTQQQGGGIGTDFSTLRPEGAILRRTGARASGPLPFMDMWHSMCSTIMSAGDRRGAMMGTMSDTHPDLLKFITAKQQKGRMTNFNVSVLVSDAFMEAVKEDADWSLYFSVEPFGQEVESFEDDNEVTQYIYSTHKARELWDMITRNTYEYSEPGVIFIDRVNNMNNLYYCEEIRCTNPCGEQPLPPDGTCNLGAVNLARMVKRPFKENAEFNYELLKKVVAVGIRFLDNVIDVTNYPLPAQEKEERAKRRLGLGISGLADCFIQLGIRYGSAKSVELTERIMETICQQAYRTSVDLAIERGSFPLLDKDKFLQGEFVKHKVDHSTQAAIRKHGIRNGVLLTVAPTGTTSILYGNISSGIEPVFDHRATRNIRQPDDTYKPYTTTGFTYDLWTHLKGDEPLPPHAVTAADLSVEDHVMIQAAVQRFIDASVSKTINLPKEISFDAFQKVYDLSYTLGCKGCTTYRPSDIRGSILSVDPGVSMVSDKLPSALLLRPEVLQGATHRIKWPSMSAAIYLTVNYTEEGFPFEVFLTSKDARYHDWMTTTSLMITALLRKGGDPRFIADELQQVKSLHDQNFIKGPGDTHPVNYPSLPAYLGKVLGMYLSRNQVALPPGPQQSTGERCPQCFQMTMKREEGCNKCTACHFTTCG